MGPVHVTVRPCPPESSVLSSAVARSLIAALNLTSSSLGLALTDDVLSSLASMPKRKRAQTADDCHEQQKLNSLLPQVCPRRLYLSVYSLVVFNSIAYR